MRSYLIRPPGDDDDSSFFSRVSAGGSSFIKVQLSIHVLCVETFGIHDIIISQDYW